VAERSLRGYLACTVVRCTRTKVDRRELEVFTGGKLVSWWQPVLSPGIVNHVRRAFALAPAAAVMNACGGEAEVVLGTYAGRPNVTSWLPTDAAAVG
jgi:hypothetical protein